MRVELRAAPVTPLDGTRPAEAIAAKLDVSVAGFEITRGIDLQLGTLTQTEKGVPSTRLHLTWRASHAARLFPIMEADLEALPLAEDETEIVLVGEYRPPFGRAGSAIDGAGLHRVAEAASVRRFFERLVQRILAAISEQ